MKKIWPVLLLLFSLILISCSDESLFEPDSDLVVIRAYLNAGKPVTGIQITSTLPLGSEETSAPPINDAVVYLTKNGVRYDLMVTPGDSGYYHYPGEDLTVESGDVFEIFVEYFGTTTSGKTEVPEPPADGTISGTTLYVPEFTTWEDMFYFEFDSTRHLLTVSWKEDPSSLFYVTIEYLDSDPDTIETFGPMGGRMGFWMISEPSNMNEYRIEFRRMSNYGEHQITVYRVNQEYADLYISRNQDSRDLNEPLTNIQNGLGIFSAFNAISFTFQVLKE